MNSWKPTNEETKGQAARLLGYYERRVREHPNERWRSELKLAQRWVALLSEKEPQTSAIEALLNDVTIQAASGGSPIQDMSIWLEAWAKQV